MCDAQHTTTTCPHCTGPLIHCPGGHLAWHDAWCDLIRCLTLRHIDTGPVDEGDSRLPGFHMPHLSAR